MSAEGQVDEPGWTEEQERLLQHERFQAELQRLRHGDSRGEREKPGWQRFLESTGGAALITVLLGGLFGNWIAGRLQESRAENERRYLTHKEYLEARLAAIRPTLERVGSTIRAAEDLTTLTRPDFDPSPERFPDSGELSVTLAKRREIREAYNEADAVWRSEKDTLGYLLAYYHVGVPGVSLAWSDLETAVTAYVDCARNWYVDHTGRFNEEAVSACADEKVRVNETMATLIIALGTLPPVQAPDSS